MLHITNGDSAVARIVQAGIPGRMLPWCDVLHEGPVPAGLSLDELREVRVRYIAGQGWASFEEVAADFAQRDAALQGCGAHDEVVLWFEHDLYDQLQLIQLLDWFAGRNLQATRLSLIQADDYLATLSPERIRELHRARPTVSPEALALGRAAWDAFRSPEPAQILALLRGDTTALPFLRGALLRHMEEFPSLHNGLSRTEMQALETIAAGGKTLRETYMAAHHDREERIFLGDTVFAAYVERLSQGDRPLVLHDDDTPIIVPRRAGDLDTFWSRQATITETGRAVLESRIDWIAIDGIDRWLGGVHLSGEAPWRYDSATQQLQKLA